jgi:hypothetical protein
LTPLRQNQIKGKNWGLPAARKHHLLKNKSHEKASTDFTIFHHFYRIRQSSGVRYTNPGTGRPIHVWHSHKA